ncbi:glucose-6-phosphatase 3-like [Stylophora pistillata]|uniref:glucose-6-phosphatase 3-like n=1 Tax=Stylophora pistillata TaxID=50429 RepID=UPI000C04A31C|nr:glucose-6-phosphatase 3-like [Stylophora pistillata]
MDVVYDSGINFIIYLQKYCTNRQKEMLFLSKVGDPRNSFLIYFPVAFHLNHSLGVSVLWTAVLSEWLNLILKWILRGDRPYWWVHESVQWKNVTLQQFELTCETGPGSPSGHAMVTSAVLCLLVLHVMSSLKGTILFQTHLLLRYFTTVIVWSFFVIVLSLVSVSRIFIATHFPHQVLQGTVIGVILAFFVRKNISKLLKITYSFSYCAAFSLAMVTITLVSHFILSILVYDPSISVMKAKKWCMKASYIHLDTTPFYALVRDSGATLGLGIAFTVMRLILRTREIIWRGFQAALLTGSLKINLSVFVLQLLEVISLPKSHPLLFYFAGFIRCSLIPVVVIFIVPSIVSQ